MKKTLLFFASIFIMQLYSSDDRHFMPFEEGPNIQIPELRQPPISPILELLSQLPGDEAFHCDDLVCNEPGLELNQLIRSDYGSLGLDAFLKIVMTLREISPDSKIIYHRNLRVFEISDSIALNEELVQEALDKVKYEGWRPKVKDRTHSHNNCLYA